MWNDEDNNPYGDSFDRRDSFSSSIANPTSPTSHECAYRFMRLVFFTQCPIVQHVPGHSP